MPQTIVTEAVSESFVIEGGQPLNGRISVAGNKNGALPILAACLLTDEPVTLTNMPRIRDVETMVALLTQLGADVYEGAEALGVELDEHIAFVVAAMRPIARELGLPKP